MKEKKIKPNKDKRKPKPRKPEPYFFVAVGMALQKKGMGPVSAGLEHFIVTDGFICKAEDCLLILVEQFSWTDPANAYAYTFCI